MTQCNRWRNYHCNYPNMYPSILYIYHYNPPNNPQYNHPRMCFHTP